ncbi:hypothetical protein G7Y79_00024g056280 [Physcia stellaris]|nr:hypothetical protein G7Y79_00024g056280 [Physcia stellaris]
MSTEADLLPYEAYTDVEAQKPEDNTSPIHEHHSTQRPSPLFFGSDDDEDAGESRYSQQAYYANQAAGEDDSGGFTPQDDTIRVSVETEKLVDGLGHRDRYHRDSPYAPADNFMSSQHSPIAGNEEDRDEDRQEYSEGDYYEDAQSRSNRAESETRHNEYVTFKNRARQMFEPLDPMSRRALEQRYHEHYGRLDHRDIDLAISIMGPSVMDFATAMARKMREEGGDIGLQELRERYGLLKDQAFDEFVERMTRDGLPYVKQCVDQQCDEHYARKMRIIEESVKGYEEAEKDKIMLRLNDFRVKGQEQADKDVKEYRDARFVEAQALAEKYEDEEYEQLDTKIAKSRAREEERLNEDMEEEKQCREAKLVEDLEKEKERKKAQQMIIMKREVQDEKNVEMAKMKKEVQDEKKVEMAKMKADVKEAKAGRMAKIESQALQREAKRTVDVDREVAEEKVKKMAMMEREARKEELSNALASKKNNTAEAAGPDLSPNASVRNNVDVQEDSLEGNTLVDITPNKEPQMIDGSAPRGKKRSRSLSRVERTNVGVSSDNAYAPDNAQGGQKLSEEDPAPSPKRQRMLEISDLCSEGQSNTSDTKPYYTRGTESVLGSLNNMKAPGNPAMLQGYVHEGKPLSSTVIEGTEATSITARHDNSAMEANTPAGTNHASATSTDKQIDGADTKTKKKYIFGKTNRLNGEIL